jgi:guanyl-specific ribonuclease Sa
VPPVGIPQNAVDTLNQIERTGTAPQGFKGGEIFNNRGRLLPEADAQGRPIRYRKWDVKPYIPRVNRGAQRLVTGSDGSAYYTGDHYRSFVKIK